MNLLELSCTPQHGRDPLADNTVTQLLSGLPGWQVDGIELNKTYHFANYHETMAFVNALAWIAHREDHHPDMSVHYNRAVVNFSTHDAGGLTLNDFICAAKTEALMRRP
ncbi:4a-hydroxytetrahydrobiopterin dehydratase [Chromobacterium sp. ATCC 53434]|uniref:4a-hydroxytetrahydrobiopterin dehydratase n=1 Tax=Chromobacterium sp. (strain ATCC 53434 / SC 14030) TaxID=2059672 RepID=UPI000C78D53E|nr:4a-hydroxytetrahydrobiopterin dehydratase [Chromobacterium sp. ATCC 53434]AUH51152.1 4a-hydroxytetrahydrobiopterin dehydratase [Chromobacterium sp. ATCC 53434]